MLVLSVIITGTSLPPGATRLPSGQAASSPSRHFRGSRLASGERTRRAPHRWTFRHAWRAPRTCLRFLTLSYTAHLSREFTSQASCAGRLTGGGPRPDVSALRVRIPAGPLTTHDVPPADRRFALLARLLTGPAGSPRRYALENALHQS